VIAASPYLACLVMAVHLSLLAWGACKHSPTADEVGHLPAGLSHFEQGRFELYRVNPPLVRMAAAIPVALTEPKTDWRLIDGRPGARADFVIGREFVVANGERSFWLFTLGRWACLPFSLLGGWVCYRWARDLYGPTSGLLALVLWCFCPNVLAHAQLLTPDVGASALGALACYAFWTWLRQPGWRAAVLMGGALGLAELAKTTLLLLYLLWPVLWVFWRLTRRPPTSTEPGTGSVVPVERAGGSWGREAAQLIVALGLSVVLLNAGYEFDGTLRPLGQYQFVSRALAGPDAGRTGNRFDGTPLAQVPVPLPQHYLLGIDFQKNQHEKPSWSYLRGELRLGGWWYYYLYALAVKAPLGTWGLLLLAIILSVVHPAYRTPLRDRAVLLAFPIVLLVLVSAQTSWNRHMRYVLPIFPFVFVWMSGVARAYALGHRKIVFGVLAGIVCSVGSSLWVYPHSMSYFNELVGGPERGHEHLINSNIDWGQDLLYLKDWCTEHPEAKPMAMACWSFFDARVAGLEFTLPPPWPRIPGVREDIPPEQQGPRPGWYAVSVNVLRGDRSPLPDGRGGWTLYREHSYGYFLRFRPVARAGYSIYIYHIDLSEANRVRRELGLPELRPERASH
jgi:hypothetical protein